MKSFVIRVSRLAILLLLALPAFVDAGPLDTSCRVGAQPAASLFLPYFEVDLEDREGATTLMSIGNRSGRLIVARVVLWSDWAIPIYAFDLLLSPSSLQTLNLRDVVARGRVPETGGDRAPFGSCASPLDNPPLDAAALEELRGQLTGQPSSQDGLCRSSDRGETSVAVGFATVDVLTDCSEDIRYPTDEGYFANDGTGLAGTENVLYGDWFLVDPSQDLAQGAELVHLPADPEFFEGTNKPSFYRALSPVSNADARAPLSSHWKTRFFKGGAFDGGTELLLWLEPLASPIPLPCGESPVGGTVSSWFEFRVRNEDGSDFAGTITPLFNAGNAFVRRTRIDQLLDESPLSGLLESLSFGICGICSPPYLGPLQSWVMPLYSAEQRFSVGLGAVRMDDLCLDP